MELVPPGTETARVSTAPAPRSGPHAGVTRPDCVAVVLAAGAGTRFRGTGHKLSATIPDDTGQTPRSVLERALTSALEADIGPVIVVTGADADVVPHVLRPRITVAHNERWSAGQITSVHTGIDAARRLGSPRVVVGLGDQPFVEPAAWRAVAAAEGPIAVATYGGRRGNPVALDAAVWELLPETGDEGARALMRVRPELVREVACTGSPADIDTTEDLRRWQSN
jgi:molybdenum cofactor cytidylyltransferase